MTPPGPARRLGFSLRDRLLALNLGTAIVLVLASLGVVDIFARQQIRSQVTQDLVDTGRVFTLFIEERAQWLRTQSLVVAEDPRFSASLDVPDPDLEAQARTVGSEAKHFQGILHSDLFVVTDRRGMVLSRLVLREPATVAWRDTVGDQPRWHVDGLTLNVVDVPVLGTTRRLAVGFEDGIDGAAVGSLLQEIARDETVVERLRLGRTHDVLWDLQSAFVPTMAAVAAADDGPIEILLCHASHGQDLTQDRAIRQALAGREYVGLRAEEGLLFHTVVVPVWSPDGLLGSLLTGFQIDDEFARVVQDMTQSHVSFFDAEGRLVASTWHPPHRPHLDAPVDDDGPYESQIGDETFLTLAGDFGQGGVTGGRYLIQRSLDEAYDFLYTLEELLLLVAFVVIVLAGVASFVGARRLTQPVQALVEGTRILGAGHLDHRIQVLSRSELGELAASFNQMAADLQRSRQTLVDSEKLRALGEMAAGVAHNFNNLLTVVVGNAELINLHGDIPEGIRQETKGILESARRCSAIVRRIQTFGRPLDMDARDDVDLADLIRDVVELTRPKWKTEPERDGRHVRIDTKLAPVPTIRTQGSAWEEILSNLIFNAVDAMPEGGLITLAAHEAEGGIVVEVTDTGTGIDEETRQRIFEPFYTTKGEDAGTGLGLSTVWGLVHHLGGRIEVESQVGQGTTFRLWAPRRAPGPPDDVSAVDSNATAPEPLDILVVDDEPQVLELIPPLLPAHRVVTARGGTQGVAEAQRGRFDVVVSDWVMDEASGLEVAAAARELDPDAVIVLMTGWAFNADEVNGGSVVDLVLPKPFERDAFVEQLAAAQRLRSQRRASRGGPTSW